MMNRKALFEALKQMTPEKRLEFLQLACEIAIDMTPTGPIRNAITVANIMLRGEDE